MVPLPEWMRIRIGVAGATGSRWISLDQDLGAVHVEERALMHAHRRQPAYIARERVGFRPDPVDDRRDMLETLAVSSAARNIDDAGLLDRAVGERRERGGVGMASENQHDAHSRRDPRLERFELRAGRRQIVLVDRSRGVVESRDAMRTRIEQQAREDKVLAAGIVDVELRLGGVRESGSKKRDQKRGNSTREMSDGY